VFNHDEVTVSSYDADLEFLLLYLDPCVFVLLFLK
jgi:hypothetical protein